MLNTDTTLEVSFPYSKEAPPSSLKGRCLPSTLWERNGQDSCHRYSGGQALFLHGMASPSLTAQHLFPSHFLSPPKGPEVSRFFSWFNALTPRPYTLHNVSFLRARVLPELFLIFSGPRTEHHIVGIHQILINKLSSPDCTVSPGSHPTLTSLLSPPFFQLVTR